MYDCVKLKKVCVQSGDKRPLMGNLQMHSMDYYYYAYDYAHTLDDLNNLWFCMRKEKSTKKGKKFVEN